MGPAHTVHFATMDMKIGPFQFYQGIRLSGRLVIMKYSIGACSSSLTPLA